MRELQDAHWLSTQVRLVCLMEPSGAVRSRDSVYVCRSADFQTAFKRALELGKRQEQTYVNVDKQTGVWKRTAIVSLARITAESLHGAAVYAEPVDLAPGEALPMDAVLSPEHSEPTQTL